MSVTDEVVRGQAAAPAGPRHDELGGHPSRWKHRISPRVLGDAARAVDVVLLAGSLLLAAAVTTGVQPIGAGVLLGGSLAAATATVLLGRPDLRGRALDLRALARIVGLPVAAGALACLVAQLAAGESLGDSLGFALAWSAAAGMLLGVHRVLLERLSATLLRAGRLATRVAICGSTPDAYALAADLARADDPLVECIGLFDDVQGGPPGRALEGSVQTLIDRSRHERIDLIVLAPTFAAWQETQAARLATTVAEIASLQPPTGPRPRCRLGSTEITLLQPAAMRDWNALLKVALDYGAGALILLAVSPLLALIAAMIKLDSPGPVFFRQRRRGFNEEQFEIFKFRTMQHAMRDPNADRLTERNDPRVTRIGRFLRRTSLDELPQLLNVLRGEMSLVGPRPHPLGAKAADRLYVEVVAGYQRRHRVKPGLTGWAQVNGWRGETATEHQILERVRHDIEYIQNWSFLLDLRILLQTARGGFISDAAF